MFRPPALDNMAPDLYLPVMGFCSYCMLCCVADLFHKGVFEPEARARSEGKNGSLCVCSRDVCCP